MKTIKLSKRVAALAEFVPEGSRLCDVGTDHGYLPIWLAQSGICKSIIASDIRSGPLESARRNAARYGTEGDIEFVLAAGLKGIDPCAADTIVIAGMGGETIAAILSESPWAMERGRALILQPMSKIDELSAFLHRSGCDIARERLVKERGDIYLVMEAQRGEAGPLTPARLHVSDTLLRSRDPLLGEYLDALIAKTRRAAEGTDRSENPEEKEKATRLWALLKEFEQMKDAL